MSTAADTSLQQRVLDELRWEPSINAAHLGVAADDHVVTLTGTVSSYNEKSTAERSAERVLGVQAIANEIRVVYPGPHVPSDPEIAAEALAALHRLVTLPKSGIDVTVSNGLVNLHGNVEWQYQRRAAESAVRDLDGVVGVVNAITLSPRLSRKLVKANIESAFQRNALIDARHIDVETKNGTIILRGSVHSAQERREAERAAWAAPGARDVDNRLLVNA
jgi:osmotically-inducible protein OsmY